MEFTPAVSLTAQIADHIGLRIIRGELKPRDRIQELKVANELSVSRGSVREALLILESRSLVEIMPRRGAVVRSLECAEVDELCDLSAEITVVFLRRLGSYVSSRRAVDTSGIEASLQRAREAVSEDDHEAFTVAKLDFVRIGLGLMGASYLRSLIEDLIPSWYRLWMLAARHGRADLHDEIRLTNAVWEAVKESNDERIGELTRAHCRRQAKMVKEVLNGKSGGVR